MALLGNPQFQIPIPGLHLSWECPISEVTQRDLVLAALEGISYFLFPTVYLLLFFLSFEVESRQAVAIRNLNDECFVEHGW